MKVIGINGSARKDGNTAILINKVFFYHQAESKITPVNCWSTITD